MKQSLVVFVCVALFLTACGGAPATPVEPTPDVNAVATQVAASIFATGTASAPKATNTPKPTDTPQATNTPRPTDTPQATDTPQPTETPEPTNTPETKIALPGAASFSTITFAAGVLNDETPVNALDTFPEGVTLVYGIFNGQGLKDGDAWRSEWLLDGVVEPELVKDHQWDAKAAGARGVWWLSLFNDQGIHTGEWQLDLYVGDQLLQSSAFTVEPYAAGEPASARLHLRRMYPKTTSRSLPWTSVTRHFRPTRLRSMPSSTASASRPAPSGSRNGSIMTHRPPIPKHIPGTSDQTRQTGLVLPIPTTRRSMRVSTNCI